jgi:trehalose/maltose hydrolase-like predicted phosphorylase
MNQGLVRRIQCFKISEERSAYVTHLLYAHRRRSSLIIQEIDIINPSEQTFDLDFQQKKQISTNDIIELDKKEVQFDSTKDKFLMITNQISTRQHNSIIYVIITNKDIPNSHVKPKRYCEIRSNLIRFILFFSSQDKQIIYTVTKYSPLLSDDSLLNKTNFKQWQNTLQTQAKEELSEALSISSKKLLKEHIDTWSSIWQSGFSISRSLAPSAMNGDVINRTIYYVLCSTPSPLYDLKIDETKQIKLNQSLFQIDQCYESHSTL